MAWRSALAVCLFLALPALAQPDSVPAKGSLADLSHRRWGRSDGAVSDEQWNQDKGTCGMVADMTPPGSGTPALRHLRTFFDCLRSKGYQPDMNDPPSK